MQRKISVPRLMMTDLFDAEALEVLSRGCRGFAAWIWHNCFHVVLRFDDARSVSTPTSGPSRLLK
jgi:hypothetical protein